MEKTRIIPNLIEVESKPSCIGFIEFQDEKNRRFTAYYVSPISFFSDKEQLGEIYTLVSSYFIVFLSKVKHKKTNKFTYFV